MLDILRTIWWGRSGWSVRDDSGKRVPLLPFDALAQLPGTSLGALSPEESRTVRAELRKDAPGSPQRTRLVLGGLLLIAQGAIVVSIIAALIRSRPIDSALMAQVLYLMIAVPLVLLGGTLKRSELRASLLRLNRCPSCGQPLPTKEGLITCPECGSAWRSRGLPPAKE